MCGLSALSEPKQRVRDLILSIPAFGVGWFAQVLQRLVACYRYCVVTCASGVEVVLLRCVAEARGVLPLSPSKK